MPVRKFYNNTFNTMLNKAIFALTKKQMQNPNDMSFFTTQGMIKFVAMSLFDMIENTPESQPRHNDDDSVWKTNVIYKIYTFWIFPVSFFLK